MWKKLLWFFNNFEFIIATLLSTGMFTLLFIQVIARYVFNHALAFTEEIAVVLFILSVYFGAIGATRRHSHLSIELVTNTLSPKNKLIANIIANAFFVGANTLLTIGCFDVTRNLYIRGMMTAVTHIPKWIFYAVIPFAFYHYFHPSDSGNLHYHQKNRSGRLYPR